MSQKLKSVAVILAILLTVACLGVCVWYLWVLNYAPGKLTSTTVNVGLQEAADGTTKSAFKVKYNSNVNKNGHEVFSLQFNYLRDEKASGLYSQGVQYETDSTDSSLKFYTYEDYVEDVNKVGNNFDNLVNLHKQFNGDFIKTYEKHTAYKGLWKGHYNATYISSFLKTGSKFNYQSVNENEYVTSTNPISESSYFTFQTTQGSTEDMVYMQFKGDNYADYVNKEIVANVPKLDSFSERGTFNSFYTWVFNNFTIDYFASIVFNAVKDLKVGSKGFYILEFGDYFKYFDVDENGCVGTEIESSASTKVQNFIKSYYIFEIEVDPNGAQKSSDTLFGQLHGSPNYKVEGYTGENGDYFTGETIIDITEKDFDMVKITDNDIALKLKKEFLNAYLPFKDKITLNVKIDVRELNYNFVGFAKDSGLQHFKINKSEVIK